jgi:hypothetical protein
MTQRQYTEANSLGSPVPGVASLSGQPCPVGANGMCCWGAGRIFLQTAMFFDSMDPKAISWRELFYEKTGFYQEKS